MDETGGFVSVTSTFFAIDRSSGIVVRIYVDGDLKKEQAESSFDSVGQASVDYTIE